MVLRKHEELHSGVRDNMKKVWIAAWVLLGAIGVVYGLMMWLGWHFIIPWIDIPLHLAGGVWVGMMFVLLFGRLFSDEAWSSKRFRILIVVVSFAAFIGVLWELFEFGVTEIGGIYFQGNIADTMGDFLMDMIGGLIGGLVAMFGRK